MLSRSVLSAVRPDFRLDRREVSSLPGATVCPVMDSALANALAERGRPSRADAPRRCDRAFIAHIVAGPKERAITAAIIGLAHAIGMSVIAKGVDTREQLARVRELGADGIHGFYFSQPLPAGVCGPFLTGCRSENERLA